MRSFNKTLLTNKLVINYSISIRFMVTETVEKPKVANNPKIEPEIQVDPIVNPVALPAETVLDNY